jgi:riboflavin synthase
MATYEKIDEQTLKVEEEKVLINQYTVVQIKQMISSAEKVIEKATAQKVRFEGYLKEAGKAGIDIT